MNPNKALWEKDDFTVIAASMRESGTALVVGSVKSLKDLPYNFVTDINLIYSGAYFILAGAYLNLAGRFVNSTDARSNPAGPFVN